MRREDGVEPHRLQAGERGLVADLGGEADERGRDRVGGVLAVGAPVALAQDAHALVLLGEVHEVEVAGERARDLVGALDRERVGDGLRARERRRCLVGVRLDRRDAQVLDVLEEARRAALAQHPPEQRSEHAHVRAHALGDLLARLESSDEVDGFGLGELAHISEAIVALLRGRIAPGRATAGRR